MRQESDHRMRFGEYDLRVTRQGSGPPVLLLHGEDGLLFAGRFVDALAQHFEVIAPSHPGWAGSPRPDHVRTIDDIAYVYLELLDSLAGDGLRPALVGLSIGGWIAAEIATKYDGQLASLALVAPLGIKTGRREDRSFVDIYATSKAGVTQSLYARAERAPDLSRLDASDFLDLAMAQEAVTRFGWQPYLHNPALTHRLHRISVPTLVAGGDADQFVLQPGYYDAYARAIGANARTAVIAGAGHRVEEEAPDELVAQLAAFVRAGAVTVTADSGS